MTEEKKSQYDQILESRGRAKSADNGPEVNNIANVLVVIAVLIFIGGAITGLIIGSNGDEWGDFYVIGMIEYWVAAFITGIIFLGFAEVISLLKKIANNTEAIRKQK